MRILFINRMLSLERGGGETFDLEISRHVEGLGHEVSYLSGIPLFSGAKIAFDHPRAHALRSPYFGWFPWDKVRGGWRLRIADFNAFQRAAVKWAAERVSEYDVIQVCELPEFVHAWKSSGQKKPVVIRLTAPNFYDPLGGVRLADAAIASGTSMETLRARGFPDIVDIPNCVDTARFKRQPSLFRALHGLADDAFVMLYVARFQAFKNHEVLVRAFAAASARWPNARLVLAGSGPLQASIRKRCAELGIAERVLFLGEVAYGDLPSVYAAADLKVISSDYESFCFAALEAMATSLPVLTTDCGWVPRLVQNGKGGPVVPVRDDRAMANAMVDLAGDPERRAEMGHINRAFVEAHHQWNRSAEKLLETYRRVLETGAA